MFIKVRHGDNDIILCNPQSLVVNLLQFLRKKTGYDVEIDLADTTGTVLELFMYPREEAVKHTTYLEEYVLVEKFSVTENGETEIDYRPLMSNMEQLPNFRITVPSKIEQEKNKKPGGRRESRTISSPQNKKLSQAKKAIANVKKLAK